MSTYIYFQEVNFDVGVAKVTIDGSCVCLVLTMTEGKIDKKGWAKKEIVAKHQYDYTFDVSKLIEIFDYLVKERFITYLVGYYVPLALEIKGKEYYDYYDV